MAAAGGAAALGLPDAADDDDERVAAAGRASQIRALRGNFVRMSMCFSMNHACVTSALALSTANLGSVLGNASNATLYVMYTLSALVFAGPHVRRRGSKQALVDSTFAFCVYVGSFYVAEVWRDVAWVAAIGGAAVGGVAAGVLFTAQGVYFMLTARAYVQLSRGGDASESSSDGALQSGGGGKAVSGAPDPAMEDATSRFAATFACIYLLSEISFKVIAWALPQYWSAGWAVVSLTYVAAAVAAAAAMTNIWKLETGTERGMGGGADSVRIGDPGSANGAIRGHSGNRGNSERKDGDGGGQQLLPDAGPYPQRQGRSTGETKDDGLVMGKPALRVEAASSPSSGLAQLRETLLLLFRPQMLLAMGMNLAYGFTSAYLTSYINGTIVAEAYGTAAVGLFAAVTPAVAGLSSPLLGRCSRGGATKRPVMVLGTVALIFVVAIPLLIESEGLLMTDRRGAAEHSDDAVGTTASIPWPLLLVYVTEGLGRGVFEGPNRAVYADWFEGQKEQAFACWIVQAGGTSSAAFFMLALDVSPTTVRSTQSNATPLHFWQW